MSLANLEMLCGDEWLLLGADENPERRPIHGVRFAFHNDAAGLRGAMVNWITGTETPLQHLRFDGATLELQMKPDPSYTGEVPTLRMTVVDNRFEGAWVNAQGEQWPARGRDPRLKLVPYRA